jgi:predicted AAA+ superfamily ATPase
MKPNHELFYYKTRNDREIDFVIKKGIEIDALIQVCYEMKTPEVEQRETKALVEAGSELKAKNLILLTWDEKREIQQAGMTIHVKPLGEWLLE